MDGIAVFPSATTLSTVPLHSLIELGVDPRRAVRCWLSPRDMHLSASHVRD